MSILDGVYCGWFDKGRSLLLTSKQMYALQKYLLFDDILTVLGRYEEASSVLYKTNTFDFDDPLALLMFARQVSPESLGKVESIVPAQWEMARGIILGKQDLRDVRLKFLDARPGKSEVELSASLDEIKRELKGFDIRTVPGFASVATLGAAV